MPMSALAQIEDDALWNGTNPDQHDQFSKEEVTLRSMTIAEWIADQLDKFV